MRRARHAYTRRVAAALRNRVAPPIPYRPGQGALQPVPGRS